MLRVSVIINPNAGPAWRRRAPREAVAFAEAVIAGLGAEPRALVAAAPEDGRELAAREVDGGADVVCAWGGDGTVNAVASAVSELGGVLAVVPAGSGNGLARELGLPQEARAALSVAVRGVERRIDVAELNGRPFFNIAGLGFDAHVAHEFARTAGTSRGLVRYVRAGALELFRYRSARYDVWADGPVIADVPALMVSVANSRQWGNRAQIAPAARLDDGLLDVVVVGETRPLMIALQAWRLLAGSIDRAPGVITRPAREITVTADRDVPVHVDGDPAGYARQAEFLVRPAALRVRVPARRA